MLDGKFIMAIVQRRSKRKVSGGLYKSYRGKRKYELGREPTYTKVGEKRISSVKKKGGKIKKFLLSCNSVNLVDKSGKYVKAQIKTIVENSANRNFVRRNILTKGAIVDTDKGKARITSRPGQRNTLDGVLVD